MTRINTSAQEIFAAGLHALEKGESVAIVTVIQSDPRWTVGARMLVHADGSMLGNLNNDQLAACVCDLARQTLASGTSRQIGYTYQQGNLVQVQPGESGEVDLFIQVLQSSPTLLLIGAGHIGEAMMPLAKMLKWRIVVVDDRPDFITSARLPDADERILVRYDPKTETLEPMPITITASTFVLVATWGWDEPVLRQIIDAPAAYLGLVASARKSIFIFRDLVTEGIAPDSLKRVRVPTGLDLGAETPAEIAVSIIAEMLMVQRHATGLPLRQYKGSAIVAQSIKGIQS